MTFRPEEDWTVGNGKSSFSLPWSASSSAFRSSCRWSSFPSCAVSATFSSVWWRAGTELNCASPPTLSQRFLHPRRRDFFFSLSFEIIESLPRLSFCSCCSHRFWPSRSPAFSRASSSAQWNQVKVKGFCFVFYPKTHQHFILYLWSSPVYCRTTSCTCFLCSSSRSSITLSRDSWSSSRKETFVRDKWHRYF